MERTSINPVPWSLKLGFDQAQLIEGHRRQLVCGGQDAVDADGNPQHPGDMAAQLELSLDNLEAVLVDADMTLANVVDRKSTRLNSSHTVISYAVFCLKKKKKHLSSSTKQQKLNITLYR